MMTSSFSRRIASFTIASIILAVPIAFIGYHKLQAYSSFNEFITLLEQHPNSKFIHFPSGNSFELSSTQHEELATRLRELRKSNLELTPTDIAPACGDMCTRFSSTQSPTWFMHVTKHGIYITYESDSSKPKTRRGLFVTVSDQSQLKQIQGIGRKLVLHNSKSKIDVSK